MTIHWPLAELWGWIVQETRRRLLLIGQDELQGPEDVVPVRAPPWLMPAGHECHGGEAGHGKVSPKGSRVAEGAVAVLGTGQEGEPALGRSLGFRGDVVYVLRFRCG